VSNTIPPYAACSICHKPVMLETTKVDEHGKAVHEECYISALTGKKPQTKGQFDTT